ncbi:uncharacterized protein BJ171DRAFT_475982 [Polychytrium aggregatum]|uniref:uncharacterized protein n=1 Tax=Polychytrium aggregatum TaxID=110093 RepID=UPI0022FF2ECD|nr:uncharacterized protein BJ171DRAFT_475982 [Polychytrium aggregatum]KAI9203336.1 hypothetical protein BJ171DRAFT_475982 [Polychytrium aggregatum]
MRCWPMLSMLLLSMLLLSMLSIPVRTSSTALSCTTLCVGSASPARTESAMDWPSVQRSCKGAREAHRSVQDTLVSPVSEAAQPSPPDQGQEQDFERPSSL